MPEEGQKIIESTIARHQENSQWQDENNVEKTVYLKEMDQIVQDFNIALNNASVPFDIDNRLANALLDKRLLTEADIMSRSK